MDSCCTCFVHDDRRKRKNRNDSSYLQNTPRRNPANQRLQIEGYTGGSVFEQKHRSKNSVARMQKRGHQRGRTELSFKQKPSGTRDYGSEYSLTPQATETIRKTLNFQCFTCQKHFACKLNLVNNFVYL